MAQWAENENGNQLQLTTTDTVGIGAVFNAATTSPMGLLHVNGNDGGGLVVSGTNLDPNAGYSLTRLQNSGNLLVGWNRSAGGGEIDLISNRYAGHIGGFAFYDYTNSGSLNPLLTVQGSGAVNIPGQLFAGGVVTAQISIGQGENAVILELPSPPPAQRTLGIDADVVAISGGLNTNGAESHMAVGGFSDPNPNVLRDLKLGANGLAVNGGLVVNSGAVGIGTVAPRYPLDISGNVGVTGNIEVTGDVFLFGADCAEEFDVVEGKLPEPGAVVVIDEDGALRESRSAYDKRVAGVVSCAGEYRHGVVLDRRPSQEPRVPVALVGKVYCKVDAQYSPIEVGDLLTTSPTIGHAMKAADPFRAFGSVIGKALKALPSGNGLIPILVALQ